MTFVCHSTSGRVYIPASQADTFDFPLLIVCHQNVCRFRFSSFFFGHYKGHFKVKWISFVLKGRQPFAGPKIKKFSEIV